jgi:DNA polymerase III subunit epsilon
VQLAEEAQVLLRTDVVRELVPKGNAETKVLVGCSTSWWASAKSLRREMDAKVREAAQGIEQEKSRLAALMSELTQSVVVCNLDGRILLYNNRARMQFRALSQAPRLWPGAELIGLGRSIYTVFDRKLVAHALETCSSACARGGAALGPVRHHHPAGQLLRVQMAPVRAVQAEDSAPDEPGPADGLCADARQHHARLRGRGRARPPAAGPDRRQPRGAGQHAGGGGNAGLPRPGARHARALPGRGARRVQTMSQRISDLEADSADSLKTRWPMEDMLGTDLLSATSAAHRNRHRLALEPPRWTRACGCASKVFRSCRRWST